jgi:hypothetical protein
VSVAFVNAKLPSRKPGHHDRPVAVCDDSGNRRQSEREEPLAKGVATRV